jgi:hypothetical protein
MAAADATSSLVIGSFMTVYIVGTGQKTLPAISRLFEPVGESAKARKQRRRQEAGSRLLALLCRRKTTKRRFRVTAEPRTRPERSRFKRHSSFTELHLQNGRYRNVT